MSENFDRFIGELRESWIQEHLDSRREELGPLYPRIVPFVVSMVGWLESKSPETDRSSIEEILRGISREKLPLADFLLLSRNMHRAWREEFDKPAYLTSIRLTL